MPFSNIDKPSKYFNTVLWTGDNTDNRSITGVGHQPDMVWQKTRNQGYSHSIFDNIRGVTKRLVPNDTASESTVTDFKSFNSDGFTIDQDALQLNATGDTNVGWSWKANGTGVSNTAGTISSTVSANTTSGFSIVTYTGAGVVASTVGHGLAVAPKLIIIKSRSNSTNWILGHNSLGWNKYMALNTTDAVETNNYFNDTAPTSSVFSVAFSTNVNGSGYTYVAYCFAEVKGFSKFGSYVGNGSTNGTFVYTGFTPAFVIFKSSSLGTTNWQLLDNKRNTFNPQNNHLRPNGSGAEFTNYPVDFLSNGFKFRNTDGDNNQSGATYIYMCFASNPFVSSKGIAVTAR